LFIYKKFDKSIFPPDKIIPTFLFVKILEYLITTAKATAEDGSTTILSLVKISLVASII